MLEAAFDLARVEFHTATFCAAAGKLAQVLLDDSARPGDRSGSSEASARSTTVAGAAKELIVIEPDPGPSPGRRSVDGRGRGGPPRHALSRNDGQMEESYPDRVG